MSAQRAQGPNCSTATLSRLKMTLRAHPYASYLTFKFSKKGFFGRTLGNVFKSELAHDGLTRGGRYNKILDCPDFNQSFPKQINGHNSGAVSSRNSKGPAGIGETFAKQTYGV